MIKINACARTQNLDEVFEVYIKRKKLENLSDDTIGKYTEDFNYFYDFITSKCNKTLCNSITTKDIEDYIQYMFDKRNNILCYN